MMVQKGYVLANAGATTSTLDPDDLAYTRDVVGRYLDAADQPTIIACLFGDKVASALGYARLGFSDRAGFALALTDARQVIG